MVKNDVSLFGSSAKKEKERRTEKVGAPQPPSTLPAPQLRYIPRAKDERKGPSEIDPRVFGLDDPADEKTTADPNTAKNTSGGARKNTAAASSAAAGTAAGADPDFRMPGKDNEAAMRYDNALAELERLRGEAPRYDSRYDAEIRDLYEQIASRAPFRYDSATDPLYQQYRQEYTAQGRAAMRDTMGQAAGLTGGYGSSYAQSVGQQQYDAYLRRLADVLPETYGMALDAWQAEGKELQRRYAAVTELEKSDYDRYLDELGQYNRSLDRARSDADAAYERMIAGDERAYRRAADDYNRRLAEDKLAYQRSKDGAKSSSGGSRKRTKTSSAESVDPKKAKNLKRKTSRVIK